MSELSEGEKKVIEILTAYKNQILERKPFTYSFIDMQWAINAILDLYQKEKEKNKELQELYTGTLQDWCKEKEKNKLLIEGKFREVADKNSYIKGNYISKDKIRELIKDINEETQYLGKDRGETKQHYAVRKIIELLEERKEN